MLKLCIGNGNGP